MKKQQQKCLVCKKSLVPVEGLGWMHPVNSGCSVDDGVVVVKQIRADFEEIYGKPTDYYPDRIKWLESHVCALQEKLYKLPWWLSWLVERYNK